MQVFVVSTSTGIWSVSDSMELAEQEANLARKSEYEIRIAECGVLTSKGEPNEPLTRNS